MTPNLFDDPRITAIGLFTEVHSGLINRFAAQFDQHNVSTVEFEVLMRLARSPGRELRMSDLASQTSLSTSGVTRVVDRMERSGLLCRRACPTDRRSSYAVITEAGLARLDETLPGHLALIEEFFTGLLDAGRLKDLLSTLRVIRDAANPGAMVGTTDTSHSGE
ncbi:DNA-binding MarR family transcriptional regulator [Catenuloplanes nepalensis]|uniref:DNA-binding MarR family transcriptional regulator n=1 Tax=Catenuloplanes nepalensis TaxID=587533 RepID=A0ABT9N464_9ACTN|nr:MarR family transcriptional regulator [Catenuloplanes nepalensis]MDP9798461.1 DNA-binding MarR family transcriptional regulator [Catenuloplanes nepalensis]